MNQTIQCPNSALTDGNVRPLCSNIRSFRWSKPEHRAQHNKHNEHIDDHRLQYCRGDLPKPCGGLFEGFISTLDNTAEIATCWGHCASAKVRQVFTRKRSDVLRRLGNPSPGDLPC